MFAHQIRPTEVSLVLYIVEELERDANFRPVSTEKSKELARSPVARYSHHNPGDQAKAWSARPPDRSGCSTAARNGKACFTVLVTRNSRGGEGPFMKTTLRRSMTALLGVAMLTAVAGCAGEPLSTRERGTLIGGVRGRLPASPIASFFRSPRPSPP